LMDANWPPFGLFQVQTFGGVYSEALLILGAPDVVKFHAAGGARSRRTKSIWRRTDGPRRGDPIILVQRLLTFA
jgi:hypothetical protein